jgi:hypothetical protein
VILAISHGLRGEDGVELVATGMLVRPFLDGVEHVSLDSDVFVAECGVVEGLEDVVDYFINWDARVLPSVQDTSAKRSENTTTTPDQYGGGAAVRTHTEQHIAE